MGDNGSNSTPWEGVRHREKRRFFLCAPDTFKNKSFQRIMDFFLSPDGKAVRMHIYKRAIPRRPRVFRASTQ